MAAFPPSTSGVTPVNELVLRAAVAAYLGRYRSQTRLHTESDLHVFLRWCTDQDLDPLTVVRGLRDMLAAERQAEAICSNPVRHAHLPPCARDGRHVQP